MYLLYSTIALLQPISNTMSAVVLRVDNSTGALKREQTENKVYAITGGYTTKRRRAWNKCVEPLYEVYEFV